MYIVHVCSLLSHLHQEVLATLLLLTTSRPVLGAHFLQGLWVVYSTTHTQSGHAVTLIRAHQLVDTHHHTTELIYMCVCCVCARVTHNAILNQLG